VEATASAPSGMKDLVDRLLSDPQTQTRWQVDPHSVMDDYSLTEEERTALLHGDVETLLASGVSDQLSRQMTVSW
jgi:hypothetical protein